MSEKVGTGYVPIKPDAEGFGRELERAVTAEGGPAAKRASEKLRRTMAGVFAGGAALIGKSVWDFAGFDRQMNEVFTLLPGISGKAMGEMSEQVKTFAADFGVLPQQVVPALYQSLSAGVPADNVFAFIETAQKLARGGVTELETAVDGLSSVVNAYGSDILSAQQASDLMFTTVKLGKTTIADLSQSIFQVTPTAAGLGVTFQDVSAALAAMTLQGVPTSVATTQLRQVLVELGKDGSKTADVFSKMTGKTFRQFIAEGGNLQGALQIIGKAADGSGLSISDMFGSVEAGSAALALTGPGAESFSNALTMMNDSAGATDAAFAQMNQGLSATMDRLRARFSVVMLNIGESIAPTLGVVGENVAKLLDLFAKLPGPMQAVAVLTATIGAGLFAFARPIREGIALFKQLGGVFRALSANPWVIVLAGLVLVAVLIVKNWDKVKSTLSAVWSWMKSAGRAAADFFSRLWQQTFAKVTTALDAFAAWWDATFGRAVAAVNSAAMFVGQAISGAFRTVISVGQSVIAFFVEIPTRIGSAFATLAGIILAPFRVAFAGIKAAWNATVGGFGFTVPSWIPFAGGKQFRIPAMAGGGVLTGPQIVLAGEYPGARADPEVVAPQSIIRQTLIEAIAQQNGTGSAPISLTIEMHVTSEVRDPAFFERQAVEMSRVINRELQRVQSGRGTPTITQRSAA